MNAPVPTSLFNAAQAQAQINQTWDDDIVHRLKDYIQIPAKSPMFDPNWAANGFIDTALWDAATWVQSQKVEGLTLEVIRLEGRTPVLFFEVPAYGGATTLLALPNRPPARPC